MLSFQKFSHWVNIKGSIAGAVPDYLLYHYFRTSNSLDIHQNMCFLHNPWTLSISTHIDKIQYKEHGKFTWH